MVSPHVWLFSVSLVLVGRYHLPPLSKDSDSSPEQVAHVQEGEGESGKQEERFSLTKTTSSILKLVWEGGRGRDVCRFKIKSMQSFNLSFKYSILLEAWT